MRKMLPKTANRTDVERRPIKEHLVMQCAWTLGSGYDEKNVLARNKSTWMYCIYTDRQCSCRFAHETPDILVGYLSWNINCAIKNATSKNIRCCWLLAEPCSSHATLSRRKLKRAHAVSLIPTTISLTKAPVIILYMHAQKNTYSKRAGLISGICMH